MGFFATPYCIHADDVVTFGTHHYLGGTQYQVAVWEGLLTDAVLAEYARARDEFEDVAMVYEDEYNRLLAPVHPGERVAVLVSLEEPCPSTPRVCFRVLRQSGQAVACGFRSIVFASRRTGEPAPPPPSFAEFLRGRTDLRENASSASFADRAVANDPIDELFPALVRRAGEEVAGQPEEAAPRRRSTAAFRPGASALAAAEPGRTGASMVQQSSTPAVPESAELAVPTGGIALVFPGPDSYDGKVLRGLYDYMPHLVAYFDTADRVARQLLDRPFLPLVHAPSLAEHDERLRHSPELADLGVYLTGLLLSEALKEKGVRPAVVMGHGFGELTALAVAGVVNVATGLEIAAQRAAALRDLPDADGGMLSLACDAERVRELLASVSVDAVALAVRNHAMDTVISGPRAELTRLEAEAARRGIASAWLAVRHAAHSPLLAPAAERLGHALQQHMFSVPLMPVYSAIEGALYSSRADYGEALTSQLVRPIDFAAAVASLRAAGCECFVECGGAGVLSDTIRRILPNEPNQVALTAVPRDGSVASGLNAVVSAAAAGRRLVDLSKGSGHR